MLDNGDFEVPDFEKNLNALVAIGKVGADDKIAQVLFGTLSFVEDVLARAESVGLTKATVVPMMDAVAHNLVEKLNDGGARIREAAMKGLKMLAASSIVGPSMVAGHTLRSIPTKQKGLWRPILGRLTILLDLVDEYSLSGPLNVDAIMNFCNAVGAFQHSNGEVRDAAKALTVRLQTIVGTPGVEVHLKGLRPKQLEEYHFAFDGGQGASKPAPRTQLNTQPTSKSSGGGGGGGGSGGGGGGGSGGGGGGPIRPAPAAKQDALRSPHHHSAHQPAHSSHEQNEEGGEDFTVCMFCGETDPTWTEDALDLHYWKDCALLSACPACAQMVEIAGQPEHLLEECEKKDEYVLCEVSGLAIRVSEFDEWKGSPQCCAPPDDSMYCPLCLLTVPDSDDLWRDHLLKRCSANQRNKKK